jgi:hypothetical protein
MKHTLNLDDFTNQKIEHILASSAGGGGSKRLVVTVNLYNLSANYEVLKSGVVDFETSILESAVRYYNELD